MTKRIPPKKNNQYLKKSSESLGGEMNTVEEERKISTSGKLSPSPGKARGGERCGSADERVKICEQSWAIMHLSHNHSLQYIILIYSFFFKHLLYVPVCNTKVQLWFNKLIPRGWAGGCKPFIGRNTHRQAEVAIFKWLKIHLAHNWCMIE